MEYILNITDWNVNLYWHNVLIIGNWDSFLSVFYNVGKDHTIQVKWNFKCQSIKSHSKFLTSLLKFFLSWINVRVVTLWTWRVTVRPRWRVTVRPRWRVMVRPRWRVTVRSRWRDNGKMNYCNARKSSKIVFLNFCFLLKNEKFWKFGWHIDLYDDKNLTCLGCWSN